MKIKYKSLKIVKTPKVPKMKLSTLKIKKFRLPKITKPKSGLHVKYDLTK